MITQVIEFNDKQFFNKHAKIMTVNDLLNGATFTESEKYRAQKVYKKNIGNLQYFINRNFDVSCSYLESPVFTNFQIKIVEQDVKTELTTLNIDKVDIPFKPEPIENYKLKIKIVSVEEALPKFNLFCE